MSARGNMTDETKRRRSTNGIHGKPDHHAESRRDWLSSGSGNDQDDSSRLDPDRCLHHAAYLGTSFSADRFRHAEAHLLRGD
jgi:hypothetical protein